MDPRQQGHLAYLLRLWRVDNGTEALWRASLQDVRTGERWTGTAHTHLVQGGVPQTTMANHSSSLRNAQIATLMEGGHRVHLQKSG
jgi:hypothetical protein